MKSVKLFWYGPYSVADLSEMLRKSVLPSDVKYPALNNYGFYIYFDENQPTPLIYVGQSYGTSPRTLGKRIRWEIVKDGKDGGAVSKFSQKCQEHKVDKSTLILKVAHIQEPSNPRQHDPNLMNDIEMALICEMQPIINDHGKKRYRRDSIEIINAGDYPPLPERIKKISGSDCSHIK